MVSRKTEVDRMLIVYWYYSPISNYFYVLDENGRVTYQLSGDLNNQFFKIDSDSGLVTISRRVDSDSLPSPRITLNVTASDHGMCNIR